MTPRPRSFRPRLTVAEEWLYRLHRAAAEIAAVVAVSVHCPCMADLGYQEVPLRH